MAKSIEYQPEPAKIGPDAHEELERLLETLHQHGVLRLVNDLVAANNEVAQVLVKGLQREGTLNVIQNVSVIVLALSSLPPDRVYKLAFGLRDMADALSQPEQNPEQKAPGVQGVWKMLQDDDLWRSLQPVLNGLKAFSRRMEEQVDKPISSYTGKPSDA
ncbi:hypothetical protein PUATCC27989T_02136 [Phytobacter ursingii]|uniref:DUF1641 domain-containing protein n=1 Tax=Phytobacter ursingii TaxID=1972431 RepID=A0AB35RQZ0_9ENTR|nr:MULTISPECIES: DUF1641 domain-containing protein [Enterobacteriaceae]MDV2863819.1 DUF1641 domain-containing protein [Phytobacter ursingii]GJL34796.1 hypothetical protein TUM17576_16160 [Enterobacter hormaechei]VTP14276.1 hypothetical protein PUATCC27989T_02136 [Phytobacter ursingii]